MRRDNDPLYVPREIRADGLVLARQAPPDSAASVSATYLAPAGFAFDPGAERGLALLTNQLIGSGAGPRSRVALARELDRLGATLHARCHPESAEVTIWGPAAAFGALLGLLADVILRPRFAMEDLERVRRQLIERQLREVSQPDSRAERELLHAVFPTGHPYRETGTGSRRSIGRIDRNAIVRFHRDHYTSSGGLLVVTAPRTFSAVRREINRRFHDFPRERAPTLPRLPPTRAVRPAYREIPMDGRSQVEILLGGPSIPRSSVEYAGAFLANEVLGARPLLSRLFQRIREAKGLAYHASSELESMRWGGHWAAQAGTGAERTDRVVPLLTAEVERIRTERVPAEELDEIRESAIGEIPLSLETTAGAHELAVETTYFDLAPDHLRRWPEQLRALSPEQVRRSAEVAFDLASACTVVAGPLPGRNRTR